MSKAWLARRSLTVPAAMARAGRVSTARVEVVTGVLSSLTPAERLAVVKGFCLTCGFKLLDGGSHAPDCAEELARRCMI